jgi:hypothetical protein
VGYRPGDSYYCEFSTASPSTGAAQNADSLPVATPNHNGADDGSFTLTVANVTTGRYKVTGTIPTGYAGGDVVNVSVAATVNTIAGVAIVDRQVLDRVGPFKINTAAGFSFRMVQSTDNKTPYTAGSVSGTRSIVGSGQGTAVSGTVTQLGSTNEYYFAGLAADFNGATIGFAFTATGANPVYLTVNTTP